MIRWFVPLFIVLVTCNHLPSIEKERAIKLFWSKQCCYVGYKMLQGKRMIKNGCPNLEGPIPIQDNTSTKVNHPQSISDWLVVSNIFYFPSYIYICVCIYGIIMDNPSHWLIFFMVKTTNQLISLGPQRMTWPDAGPQQWRGVISVAYASLTELQEAVQRLEQLKGQAGRMAGEFQLGRSWNVVGIQGGKPTYKMILGCLQMGEIAHSVRLL